MKKTNDWIGEGHGRAIHSIVMTLVRKKAIKNDLQKQFHFVMYAFLVKSTFIL